jgi:hypothetical protein
MKSSLSPALKRTVDLAPGNSEAVFMLITTEPCALPWIAAACRSSGMRLF